MAPVARHPPVSYPRPASTTVWESIQPRPLPPFSPPPHSSLVFPQLPSPSRQPLFSSPYILTTHVFPAAYPRITPDFPLPPTLPVTANKLERKDLATENAKMLLKRADQHADAEIGPGSRKVLWNCVNRYVRENLDRQNQPGGLTLFFAHANGFPKEVQNIYTLYMQTSYMFPFV
jgi:hypothetical protein